MSRNNDAFFNRGATGYMGATPDSNNLRFTTLLGSVKVFEDVNLNDTDSAKNVLSPRRVVCMLVRNQSSGALLPGDVVTFAADAPYVITAKVTAANLDRAYVVDEYLPAAGVANYDVFWAVIKGPCDVKIQTSGGATKGDPITTSTTSGRAGLHGTPADATAARNQAEAQLGVIMEDAATGADQVRALIFGNAWRCE